VNFLRCNATLKARSSAQNALKRILVDGFYQSPNLFSAEQNCENLSRDEMAEAVGGTWRSSAQQLQLSNTMQAPEFLRPVDLVLESVKSQTNKRRNIVRKPN